MPEQQNPEHQLEYLKELRRKYEEALSNAQKSGDYSEAEKLKQELDQRLTALEALFPMPEPVTNSIEKVEKGETAYERAMDIMGQDFFGYAEINQAFGSDIAYGFDCSDILYTEKELLEAKKNNEMLVLRAGSLTMETIDKKVKLSEGRSILFEDTVWYEDEDFFTKQTTKEGWALVSKDTIPGSMFRDYFDQTAVLRDRLRELGSLTQDELVECTDDKLEQIKGFTKKNWKAAAKELAKQKINQNHRRTPVEALYDFALCYYNLPKDIMLRDSYDWTNTLGPNGGLVYIGRTNQGYLGRTTSGFNLDTSSPLSNDIHSIGVISVR